MFRPTRRNCNQYNTNKQNCQIFTRQKSVYLGIFYKSGGKDLLQQIFSGSSNKKLKQSDDQSQNVAEHLNGA